MKNITWDMLVKQSSIRAIDKALSRMKKATDKEQRLELKAIAKIRTGDKDSKLNRMNKILMIKEYLDRYTRNQYLCKKPIDKNTVEVIKKILIKDVEETT